jgi:predicted acylesterase/phospholipase RssA
MKRFRKISVLSLLFVMLLAQPGETVLVLSGGGLRGMAHIGVLKAIEKNQIKVDRITGTSFGALVGAMYAIGYSPDEIEEMLLGIDWEEIFNDRQDRTELLLSQKNQTEKFLLELSFSPSGPVIPKGFSSGKNLRNMLSKMVLSSRYGIMGDFSKYRIPVEIIATDLITGKSIVFRKGNLAECIHASIAVPLLFEPVRKDSMLLVDGGLRNNLPVIIARRDTSDIIIASDLTSPLRNAQNINAPWEVADQVSGIMMQGQLQDNRAATDILIRPKLASDLPEDWSALSESISAGLHMADSIFNAHTRLKKDKPITYNPSDDMILSGCYFQGNYTTIITDTTLLRNIRFNLRQTYNRNRSLSALRSTLESVLARNSFIHYKNTLTQRNDSLIITIDQLRIDSVFYSGNEKTKDFVIDRELEIHADDILTNKKIVASYNNLNTTGLFDVVGFSLKQQQNGKTTLEVALAEKQSSKMSIGARYDNVRNALARIEFMVDNPLGYAIKRNIWGELGDRRTGLGIEIYADKLGYTDFTAGANLFRHNSVEKRYINKELSADYDYLQQGAELYLGWQIERFGRVIFSGIFRNAVTSYENDFANQEAFYSIFSISSVADRRNSKVYPTSGIFNQWSFDAGYVNNDAGSTPYFKFFLQLSEWYRLADHHAAGIVIQTGLAESTIPYEEFFNMAGPGLMPGVMEREKVGRSLWFLRTNYRYRFPFDVIWPLYAHVGAAVGIRADTPSEHLEFENEIYGAELGLSFDTFIGPLAVQYGRNSDPSEIWTISLGYPF